MEPWKCQIENSQTWTVGELKKMACSGETLPERSDAAPPNAYVKFKSEEDQYKLKILSVERLDRSIAEFTVTSYKAGDHANLSFSIVSSDLEIPVAPMTFSIQSVLEKGKQEEPQGFFGPYTLGYPVWVWLVAAVLLGVAVFSIVQPVRKIKKRQRLRREMDEFKTPLTAFQQLLKDFRGFAKKLENNGSLAGEASTKEEFRKIFSNYILRQFQVPTHAQSMRSCLKQIEAKYPRLFLVWGDGLKKLTRESDRFLKAQDLSPSDYLQMIKSMSRLAEKIDKDLDRQVAGS